MTELMFHAFVNSIIEEEMSAEPQLRPIPTSNATEFIADDQGFSVDSMDSPVVIAAFGGINPDHWTADRTECGTEMPECGVGVGCATVLNPAEEIPDNALPALASQNVDSGLEHSSRDPHSGNCVQVFHEETGEKADASVPGSSEGIEDGTEHSFEKSDHGMSVFVPEGTIEEPGSFVPEINVPVASTACHVNGEENGISTESPCCSVSGSTSEDRNVKSFEEYGCSLPMESSSTGSPLKNSDASVARSLDCGGDVCRPSSSAWDCSAIEDALDVDRAFGMTSEERPQRNEVDAASSDGVTAEEQDFSYDSLHFDVSTSPNCGNINRSVGTNNQDVTFESFSLSDCSFGDLNNANNESTDARADANETHLPSDVIPPVPNDQSSGAVSAITDLPSQDNSRIDSSEKLPDVNQQVKMNVMVQQKLTMPSSKRVSEKFGIFRQPMLWYSRPIPIAVSVVCLTHCVLWLNGPR